jgi:hypothetical protein
MSMWPILLQPLLLLLLAWVGLRHVLARPPTVTLVAPLPATLIVPLTGDSLLIRQGLDTLLAQDPAPARIVLAVWDEADPAHLLARELAARHAHVDVALGCLVPAASRKNANLLAGVAAADPESRAFVFCDAGHLAPPDLTGLLLEPILGGQATVTSGYHRLTSGHGLANLLHETSVLFLHCLQGLPLVTQPWGGAMAMDKGAFETLGVEALWRDNVVDDCSLAALLQDHGQQALMVSGANVGTPLGGESFGQWWAWWVRQLQYMKYCFPGTWILAGAGLAFLGLPPLAGAAMLVSGHKLLGALYFLTLGLAALAFRRGALRPAALGRWLAVFPLFLILSLAAYAQACRLRVITWREVAYTVGKKGVVLSATASTAQPGPANR